MLDVLELSSNIVFFVCFFGQTTTTTTNTFLAAHLDSPLSFNKLLKKFTCIQINILKKFRKFLNPKPILIEGFRSKCIKDTHNLYSNS